MKLKVLKGSIFEVGSDCIVVPQHRKFVVNGRISQACNKEGMCVGINSYIQFLRTGGEVNVGDAIITPSGKAGFFLAHVTTADVVDADSMYDAIYSSILKVLAFASVWKYQNVAVPVIGENILPRERAAEAVLAAVKEYSKQCDDWGIVPPVSSLSFVVYKGDTTTIKELLNQ